MPSPLKSMLQLGHDLASARRPGASRSLGQHATPTRIGEVIRYAAAGSRLRRSDASSIRLLMPRVPCPWTEQLLQQTFSGWVCF